MQTHFDTIATQYSLSKDKTFRLVEEYSYLKFLGDVKGLEILDLACGSGHYSRILAERGAKVTGVDISEAQLAEAIQIEEKNPQGIKYLRGDIASNTNYGMFDLATAVFLLHFADTEETLFRMCQTIYNNLKAGGRFVTYNDNVAQAVNQYSGFEKYGFHKALHSAERTEGKSVIRYEVPTDAGNMVVDFNWFAQDTYERALRNAGFKEIKWINPVASTEMQQQYPPHFWDTIVYNPPMIIIECRK